MVCLSGGLFDLVIVCFGYDFLLVGCFGLFVGVFGWLCDFGGLSWTLAFALVVLLFAGLLVFV